MRRAGMASWCKMKGETVHVDPVQDCIANSGLDTARTTCIWWIQ